MLENKPLHLLIQDQAEYYFVCDTCWEQFKDMQWAGTTRAPGGWRERAALQKKDYEFLDGTCEFCGPHGNGGWMIGGVFPAAIRRDSRK